MPVEDFLNSNAAVPGNACRRGHCALVWHALLLRVRMPAAMVAPLLALLHFYVIKSEVLYIGQYQAKA